MATHNLNWLNKFPGRVFRCENENLTEVTNAVTIGKVVVTEAVVVEKLIDKPVSVSPKSGIIEQVVEEETESV